MSKFPGKILLVGNYLPDRQESMQRFGQMLFAGLEKRGVSVELIRPEPFFGKLWSKKWFGYVDKLWVFPNRLKSRLSPGTVVHFCDHSNAVYTKYARGIPHLVTCHDMLAIRSARGEFPENRTRTSGRVLQRMILCGLDRAQRVVCVSSATRTDVQRLTKLDQSRVTVIENGLNYDFRPVEKRPALSVPQKYLLHVGGNQWYKNREGVLAIYRELTRLDPNVPDLVFAGKALPESIASAARGLRVHSIREPGNEDLRALYSNAEALLFPSLAEGFGWPVIEAQACGCPVVTSNRAPMNEIGGMAAVDVDPQNHVSAARALHALLSEGEPQKAARRENGFANAKRFDAERMIDRYVDEYALVAAMKR